MVTDKRILGAINGVKDKTLRDTLLKGGDITPQLFKDNIDEFKRLLPVYFDKFTEACTDIMRFSGAYIRYECKYLYAYLCLELGTVDPNDFTTVKNFVESGIPVKDLAHYAPSSTLFAEGLKKKKFNESDVLDFIKAEPQYLTYLLPLAVAVDSDIFAAALEENLKSAKLEDGLRYQTLYAMLISSDAAALKRYTELIDANNFYRLRAMNDVAVSLGDYTVILPPKELVSVLHDAAGGNTDKYLNADFRHAYFFIEAFYRVHNEQFSALAVKLLRNGGTRARQALFHSMPERHVNGVYAHEIFSNEITLEDLSFFLHDLLWTDTMSEKEMPLVFDTLYKLLLSMDKVSYHFKTDEDISFARDVSKKDLIRPLATIADRLKDKRYTELLDGIYDTLREEAQAAYLQYNGDKTKLDKRQCAVKFLKTDNYNAIKYYDGQKIKLTYSEAVAASDYLKSKKQIIKSKIIKEFLRSPDKQKIAEYLLSAAEDYKVQAGKEMQESEGKVSSEKLEEASAQFYWNSESVFKVEKPEGEIKALAAQKFNLKPIKIMSYERYKAFTDALKKFVADNADFEYDCYLTDGKVTLGSTFLQFKDSAGASKRLFAHYPLGEKFKQLYKDNLTEEEIACLSVLQHCAGHANAELFYALCGKNGDSKKIFTDFNKKDNNWRSVSSPENIIHVLAICVLNELLSGQTLCRMLYMYNSAECIKRIKEIKRERHYSAAPDVFVAALNESTDIQTVKISLSVECAFVAASVSECPSYDVFKRAYEYGLITDELARYFMLKHGHFSFVFGAKSGKECLLRKDYAFPKFKKALTDFLNDAFEAEFKRGNLQTAYSELISRTPSFGLNNYMRAIVSLRKLTWVRSPYGYEKNEVFSKILKNARAAETDSYELFDELVTKYNITRDELIRATLFNPVYVDYTAQYLKIPNLKLAVYWFIAHLNETLYGDEMEEREQRIKEFSDISYPDFQDGAFDSRWYNEMVSSVPADELKRIYDNAKYVTVGGLHKRAQRFFDAVNGRIEKAECLEKINGSRNKDYCLIYSLIPVKDAADLRERYETLSEFLRQSKQFGSQRQLSERRTVDIAFENLARAAGYSDVEVFRFEMESNEPSDIYKPYAAGGITVTPYIDERAFKVAYRVEKDGKKLSAIPQKAGKDKEISSLRENIKELNKKFKRIIYGFEQCMVTRTAFRLEQIQAMCREQIIQTVLSRLLLLADGEPCVFTDGGLQSIYDGEVKSAKEIIIAHPIELKEKGALPAAVDYIVKNNVKQPFKQVLREIYPLSEQEKEQDEILRFKGFNVDLKKCVAALKGRGWGVSEDIGLRKVYYKTDTVAAIFRECDFWYIADYENVNRELHGIFFLKRKTGEIIPPKDVDAITLSETLRDVDLMISISSNTIYDFELAMSSVEMRQAVLKSIVGILNLTNVGFLKDNIRVMGQYGTYTVNIRTGLVFKDGKGNLMLDTVYSVDKPLLLDFVDEDPMTADIISKAIVLANDKTVRDPAVLNEIKD